MTVMLKLHGVVAIGLASPDGCTRYDEDVLEEAVLG